MESGFSIMIPTWNNLAYLKLCLESIKKNSKLNHEILVHVNDGSDGSLDWIKTQNVKFTHSPENIGICWSVNQLASKATTDYIMYMNDDMYVLPNWDIHLMNEIKKIGHNKFFLSSTMIEPTDTKNPCVIVGIPYGTDIESFQEQQLLAEYESLPMNDWTGATWPPNVVHKDLWHLIGGYSVEFSPGMYSDPDFSMKLWQAGVRLFKGIAASRVFHFQCKSTGKVKKNPGKIQFLKKWNISSANFCTEYLQRGKPYVGELTTPQQTAKFRFFTKVDLLRARFGS